ncbi:terminase small subunit [Sporomusa malonica]|uniref:Phage terminase small subunit n=1 Tax=Sporomusa malonica TaxID=112901 RepID=A0A1W2AS07_9FIRM|nr:terminase small subunit [Sporomusa malonica]SMC63473.1 phage terminase small subunit [Sporomusa malonica]
MPRQRSPQRDKAFEIWKNSGGKKQPKDIASELGVSDVQVRKWKSEDKWDGEKKGNVTKKKIKSVPKKKSNVTKPKPSIVPNQMSVGVTAVFSAPDNVELTEKEDLFCKFFVVNMNATQAAIKAGYSPNSARGIGYENLTKQHIRAEVERLKAIRNQAIMLSEDDIVERQMRIAFADMTDFLRFGSREVLKYDKEGNEFTEYVNYIDLNRSTDVDGGLISEIKQGVSGISFKLESRDKAMKWLSDYFEINPEHKHRKWYDSEKLKLSKEELTHRKETDSLRYF